MRIGIDMMGGDFAPLETTLGAIQARKELDPRYTLVLIGNESEIREIFRQHHADDSGFVFVNTSQVIGMADHPTKAFQQKTDSSIAVGFHLLKEKKIDAFASAGNTGAMMVGSMFAVKPVQGILRPAISSIIPKEDGGVGIILDVGINADCKPEVMQQFAILGSIFAENVYHINNPKIGLMSIGEEDEKGNILTKESHQLIKTTPNINFIGNLEGRDMFNNRADVIVCDGFTGNVMLKLAESFYSLIRKRGIHDEYFDRFDFENYGGTPVLGVNSTVIIAHGISNAKAIKNMILLSKEVAEAGLAEKISKALADTPVSEQLPK
ncbi:MAG: phosphate acyltransferase PlsX [Bacteroidetes bacterium]|nr:phosphate acyltransferase PlsX [Bacteroidota bacterium]MBK9423680.1 phosphate acyltransferase PlsX [Bacteroidota bacterium]